MKTRTEDEMKTFFLSDAKLKKSTGESILIKTICWAIVAVIVLFAVYSKTAQDEEKFKAEQAYKAERG